MRLSGGFFQNGNRRVILKKCSNLQMSVLPTYSSFTARLCHCQAMHIVKSMGLPINLFLRIHFLNGIESFLLLLYVLFTHLRA